MVEVHAKPADRLYEIDALRIFAALAVVVYHYTFSGFAGGHTPVSFPALSEVTRFGYLGVDLFFTISGFVVLMSAWDRRPGAFVVSRITRLYPAYWVAVTLTAIVSVLFSNGHFRVTVVQYLANLTMVNSLANMQNVDVVYWTLWAELRFYALIFVLCVLGITRRKVLAVLWGWLALTVLMELGVLPAAADLVVQSQFSHYFITGMALFVGYRSGFSWQVVAIIAICWDNAIIRGIQFSEDVGTRYQTDINPFVVSAIISCVFLVMLLIATRVTRPLGRPGFVHAGALTYPLYLVHAHIGFVIIARVGDSINPYVLVVGTILLMLGLAYVIHSTVEKKFAPVLKRALQRIPWLAPKPRKVQPAG